MFVFYQIDGKTLVPFKSRMPATDYLGYLIWTKRLKVVAHGAQDLRVLRWTTSVTDRMAFRGWHTVLPNVVPNVVCVSKSLGSTK